MCGIVAVVPAPVPPRAPDLRGLAGAVEGARIPPAAWTGQHERTLRHTDAALTTANRLLNSPAAEQQLVTDYPLVARLRSAIDTLDRARAEAEDRLDAVAGEMNTAQLETDQQLLGQITDTLWALRHDRLDRVDALRTFLGAQGADPAIAPLSAVTGYSAIETALRGLDRLEVRGRDSAGLHVWVRGPGVARVVNNATGEIASRHDPLLTSGTVARAAGGLTFTYKTAAITGKLGDNARALREKIIRDQLLARVLHIPGAQVSVLAHTRWASVGRVSEPNACPVHQVLVGSAREDTPYTVAALNGDIDNHLMLRATEDIDAGADVATDAKLFPVLLARKATRSGGSLTSALAETVASCAGSFAVAAQSERSPDTLLLAVRGSGQSLYVGVADGAWVVASEPYGLVSETDRYVRIDGAPGALVELHRAEAGDIAGLCRYDIDGHPMPVSAHEVTHAQVTTRDIDRGSYSHFLLKELAQAPESVAKTLRGRIAATLDDSRRVWLREQALPHRIVAALRSGAINRIILTGQGTAAVACDGVARIARRFLDAPVTVAAMPATELSAWHLDADMRDCLLVAVSQSGTTTDTNRAVDLARARGAAVVAIVNRRESDLTAKADGVLYTSDGRDIEMAVASTKAFYAQVTAGILLTLELRGQLSTSTGPDRPAAELLAALADLPGHLAKLINSRGQFQAAAHALATRSRHWAAVGSGLNKVAAEEIRIKLSELCYRTVSTDSAEDKKHVDLSAEATIVVCAAGVGDAHADDLDKEVSIFAAHDNTPVVIASEGQSRFRGADHVLLVPETHPDLAWLLGVAAGHLFAYECATAIDAVAHPLRGALARLREPSAPSGGVLDDLRPFLREFLTTVSTGARDGCLSPRHVLRLARLTAALNTHSADDGTDPLLTSLLTGGTDDLEQTLIAIIEELTRPIDTVKHQAKTVTVGTSRTTPDSGATLSLTGAASR